MQCVIKNKGLMYVQNEKKELVLVRLVGWRVCMDYR